MKPSFPRLARQISRGLLYSLLFVIPFSKAAIEILFPLLLAFWWIGWHSQDPPRPRPAAWPAHRVVLISLWVYLGACGISILLSSYPFLSLRGFVSKTLEYAMLFVIACDVAAGTVLEGRILRSLVGASWVVILYGLLQEWLIHHPVGGAMAVDPIRRQPMEYMRMIGPYENPNDLATFLMVVVLILIASLLKRPLSSRMTVRWILVVLLLGGLASTGARGALLGFAVGLFVLLLLMTRERTMWLGGAAALVFTAGFLLYRRGQFWEVLTLSDVASVERLEMWQTGWNMVKASPWWGLGLNTFMANYQGFSPDPNHRPAYAHNCFLQVVSETGVIGLVAFLGFLTALFWVCGRALRRVPDSPWGASRSILSGLLAGLAAFLVQSLLDTNLYALRQATLFWTLAGIGVGMSRNRLSGAKETTEHVPSETLPFQRVAGAG